MLTEQLNPNTHDIDRVSTEDMIRLINAQDMTVAHVVQAATPQIAAAVDAMVERLRRGGRIIYVGAGTSGRMGMMDAVECVPTFGTPPELFQAFLAGGDVAFRKAIEGAEDRSEDGEAILRDLPLSAEDVVVGIAASGRTPFVLGAMAYAREVGARTIGISCNDPAPLLDAAELPIALPVGPEVISGSTRLKAGTAQKMVLNMLSTGAMVKSGKVYRNLMVDVKITNEKLARRAVDLVVHLTDLDAEAARTLLAAADNHVKAAVVMHHKQVDYAAAQALLGEHNGFLRAIIE
ncbi:MAG: N-acetylmuramic acid 6-phosphate etherase [Chloroflexota bacterium]